MIFLHSHNRWRRYSCAETAMSDIGSTKSCSIVTNRYDDSAFGGPSQIERFTERSLKVLALMEKWGIPGVTLEEVDTPNSMLMEMKVIRQPKVVPVLRFEKTSNGPWATFGPLVHAAMRATRDNTKWKWLLLEIAAKVLSEKWDVIKADGYLLYPSLTGAESWLQHHPDPKLWVDLVDEQFLAENWQEMYPGLLAAVLAYNGRMDEIKESITVKKPDFHGLKYPKDGKLRFGELRNATNYVTVDGIIMPTKYPGSIKTNCGAISVAYYPLEWFEAVDWHIKA